MKARPVGRMFVLLATLWLAEAVHALPLTYTFATQPGTGVIQGAAGELIGWGYGLTNQDSSNWFVTTALSASSFTLGTPDGSYFDFPILAPGQHVTVNFDPVLYAGLYGLTLGNFALPGQQDIGTFTLDGEWWSGDPFGGGTLLQAADAAAVNFTVAVVTAPGGAVPAPTPLLLLGTGLTLLSLFRKGTRQKF